LKSRHHSEGNFRALGTLARKVAVPRNYFHGARHGPFVVPDNIIVFVRRSLAELQDGTFSPHYHNRWVLIVPIHGSGTVIVDGGRHRLQPGVGLLVSPLRLHYYDRAPRRGLCWLFFTFELPGSPSPVAGARVARFTPSAVRTLSSVVKIWTEQAPGGIRGAQASRMAAELSVVLGEFVRSPIPGPRLPAKREATLLGKIKAWIEDGDNAGLGLTALSRHVGLSESRLRTWFRQEFGLSLGRYIRETRCRQAAHRLKTEGLGVAEVAAGLGFSSAFSFSRTFKSVLGVSPSEFAKPR